MISWVDFPLASSTVSLAVAFGAPWTRSPGGPRRADRGLDAEPALAVGADRAGDPEGDRQVVVRVDPERPLEPRPVLGHDDDPAAGHGLAVGVEQAAGHDRRVGGVGRSVLGGRRARQRAPSPARPPGPAWRTIGIVGMACVWAPGDQGLEVGGRS